MLLLTEVDLHLFCKKTDFQFLQLRPFSKTECAANEVYGLQHICTVCIIALKTDKYLRNGVVVLNYGSSIDTSSNSWHVSRYFCHRALLIQSYLQWTCQPLPIQISIS